MLSREPQNCFVRAVSIGALSVRSGDKEASTSVGLPSSRGNGSRCGSGAAAGKGIDF